MGLTLREGTQMVIKSHLRMTSTLTPKVTQSTLKLLQKINLYSIEW